MCDGRLSGMHTAVKATAGCMDGSGRAAREDGGGGGVHLVGCEVVRGGRGEEEDLQGVRLHGGAAAREGCDGRRRVELHNGAAGEVVQRLEVEAVVGDDEDAGLLDERRHLPRAALEQHALLELVCQPPVVETHRLRLLLGKLLDHGGWG